MNWTHFFTRKILYRGLDYYQCSQVHNLKYDGYVLRADVEGSEVYEVKIFVDQQNIEDMHCTCPYAQEGHNCKHMAATLFQAKDFYSTFVQDYNFEEEEFDEYDEYDEYDAYEESNYSPSLSYTKSPELEKIVSLASVEEKDQFIKEILYTFPEYQSVFVQAMHSPDSCLLPVIYQKEMDDLEGEELDAYVSSLIEKMKVRNWNEEILDCIHYVLLHRSVDSNLVSDILSTMKDDLNEAEKRIFYAHLITYHDHRLNKELLSKFDALVEDADIWKKELLSHLNVVSIITQSSLEEKRKSLDELFDISSRLGLDMEMLYASCSGNIPLQFNYYSYLVQQEEYEKAHTLLESIPIYDTTIRIHMELCLKDLIEKSGCKEYALSYYQKRLFVQNVLDMDVLKNLKQYMDNDKWEKFRSELLPQLNLYQKMNLYYEEDLLDVLIEELQKCSFEKVLKYKEKLRIHRPAWLLRQYSSYLRNQARFTQQRSVYAYWAELLMEMLDIKDGASIVNQLLFEWKTLYGNRRAMMEELQVVRRMIPHIERRRTIILPELLEAMESANEDVQTFYEISTGKIHYVFAYMDEEVLEEMEDSDDFIALPDKNDIHEYRLMEDFIRMVKDEEAKEKLHRSIRGKGAFRRFKEKVCILGLQKEWFDYRDQKYREIAQDWCMKYDITPIEKM
ncbi:MAG: UPF0158 family protein [Bacillota bacterium]|nr:UPF0158 family protein [Bacillota bacterium]